MTTRIQLRRDTAANWASENPILAAGEPGVDLTNGVIRVGNGGSRWTELPLAGFAQPAVDIRSHGALDGAEDNTAAILDAANAAAGGTLVIPPGLWITDPVPLASDTSVHVYGTLQLRGQDAANLPAAHGVLYSYGTSEAHNERVHIIGFGGTIDGNRRGMTNTDALTYDQEGINFKYTDYGSVAGDLTITDTIESGVDFDNSAHNYVGPGVHAKDCYGNGFHMSNGATDNLLDGPLATGCGFGNNRNGFDQYAGSTPEANRNKYIACRAYSNNRNFRIDGEFAIFEGNTSVDGTNPDEVSANVHALDPKAPVLRPRSPQYAADPTGDYGAEDRALLIVIADALRQAGMLEGPTPIRYDDFATDSTTLGSETIEGVAWTQPAAGFAQSSGSAVIDAGTGTIINAYLPSGTDQVRLVSHLKLGGSGGRGRAGLTVRATAGAATGSGAYIFVELVKTSSIDRIAIRRRDGSTSTDLAALDTAGLVAGTEYTLELIADEDVITVKLDGVERLTHTLSEANYAAHAGQNRHGLFANVGLSQDDGTTAWRDFKVYTL
jgi:hypothetical protein